MTNRYMLEFNGPFSAYLWEGDRRSTMAFYFSDGTGGREIKPVAKSLGVKVQPFTPKVQRTKTEPKTFTVKLKTVTRTFDNGVEAHSYAVRFGGSVS